MSAPAKLDANTDIGKDRYKGHLGHLNEEEEGAFAKFKAMLAEHGYYFPGKHHGDLTKVSSRTSAKSFKSTETSHDDSTLLRFLRARSFDVHGAFSQFTGSEDWRKENNVAELYDTFPVAEFTASQQVYPLWTGRTDKHGLPVYVFKISGLTKDVVNAYQKPGQPRLDQRMIVLYEHMVQFVLPFCSAIPREHEEVPVSASATIVDISHVGLSRFWALRSHMQRASTLASANYAETLGAIYLIGAPSFFSVVWGWIGKWFDPGTVEKIFILADKDVLPTLTRFIDIENIPKAYGGKLDWTYGESPPSLDDAGKKTLGQDTVPEGPIRFTKNGLVIKGEGR